MIWLLTLITRTWRTTWHRPCVKISCQSASAFDNLRALIPQHVEPQHLLVPKAFRRDRKLPYPRLITTILSLTAGGKATGVQTKIEELFRTAARTGLWHDCNGLHRSALTKARARIAWTAFEDLFYRAVAQAQTQLPPAAEHLCHGMSVYAIDGSKYTLPASAGLRQEFDPSSGLQHSGKGHFPQALVSTAIDVLRHLPIARTVAPANTSERAQASLILPHLPANGIAMYDRGYPSYDFIRQHQENYAGYFLFRCPAQSTFAAVQRFVKSAKEEDILWLVPASGQLKKSISLNDRLSRTAVKIRVIKLRAPDGTLSVLLTNLFGAKRFSKEEIINLYFRRWAVETYYRDEKETLRIETFHSMSANGIRQELFASVAMAVIAQILTVLAADECQVPTDAKPQFKNALITLAHEAAILVPKDPVIALRIFEDILKSIARVKYYRPTKRRPSPPRVCKQPPNKWTFYRAGRLANA